MQKNEIYLGCFIFSLWSSAVSVTYANSVDSVAKKLNLCWVKRKRLVIRYLKLRENVVLINDFCVLTKRKRATNSRFLCNSLSCSLPIGGNTVMIKSGKSNKYWIFLSWKANNNKKEKKMQILLSKCCCRNTGPMRHILFNLGFVYNLNC